MAGGATDGCEFVRELHLRLPSGGQRTLRVLQSTHATEGSVMSDAALVFVNWMQRRVLAHSAAEPPCRTVELGAGTAACSMALAAMGCRTCATDQLAMLPLMRRNVADNFAPEPNGPQPPTLCALDWKADWRAEEVAQFGAVDMVLAVDCVYYTESVEPLLRTMHALCASGASLGGRGRAVVVHERRDLGEPVAAQRLFYQRMGDLFTVRSVGNDEMDPDYRADDIACLELTPRLSP